MEINCSTFTTRVLTQYTPIQEEFKEHYKNDTVNDQHLPISNPNVGPIVYIENCTRELVVIINTNNDYSDILLKEIKDIKGKNTIKSRHDLLRNPRFGKSALDQSFSSQA